MKRKLFLLSMVLVYATGAFAQINKYMVKDDPKFSIGVSLGAGIPLGDFGNITSRFYSGDSRLPGYAKIGFHFNVSTSYMLTEHFGAIVLIGGNIHALNFNNFSGNGLHSISISSDGIHYLGHYMAGPVFVFPLNEMWSLDAKVLAGLMTISYPTTNYNDSEFSVNYKYQSTMAISYGCGIGAKYKITELVSIIGHIDYLMADPKFTNLTESFALVHSNTSPEITTYDPKTSMNIGLINTTLGVGFNF